jgi:serine O-acetyltransferase
MIRNKKDYIYYRERDLQANQLQKVSFYDYWWRDTLRFQLRLRKIAYLHNVKKNIFIARIRLFLLEIINHRLAIKLGFPIPENVFGTGMCLVHYGTIVVNANAKIGANGRIHPSASIGDYNGIPTIGANAVVNSDIPDNVSVGGIPTKIISNKSSLQNGFYRTAS